METKDKPQLSDLLHTTVAKITDSPVMYLATLAAALLGGKWLLEHRSRQRPDRVFNAGVIAMAGALGFLAAMLLRYFA